MAYYGLKKPIVAKRTAAGTYDIPQGGLVQFARAIAFSVAPTFAEAALACDDDPHGEYEKEFVEADVTLGTDTVPVDVNEVLFGATVSASASGTGAEQNVVTYKKDDRANEVGTAVIGDEVLHGVKKWVAVFLPRVKYADPGEAGRLRVGSRGCRVDRVLLRSLMIRAEHNDEMERADFEALFLL